MNVVREIQKINDKELDLALSGGASWHDEYKDSAYVFVGGLNTELTEGDVITIFSQYGEVMDVNLPRDKETGKPKGFGFIMYEDQRSTVLAVDNLNGANVLERTLRVDHVKNYKQKRVKNAEGEWEEPDEQSLNAKPELIMDGDDAESQSDVSSGPEIDPEDPMYEYLVNKRKEEKALKKAKKAKSSSKRKDETPDERRARKEKKRAKKEKKHAGVKKKDDAPADRRGDQEKSLEELMREFQNEGRAGRTRIRSPSGTPPRESQQSLSRTLPGRRSRSPATDDRGGPMAGSKDRRSSRSRSPRRDHGRHRDDDSDMRYTERRRR